MRKILLYSFMVGASLFRAQNYMVSTAAGNGFLGNVNGTATNCEFNRPYAVKSDNDSVIYIADLINHSIRKLNINTNMVSTVAGTGVAGSTDGIGTVAQFNMPGGLFYKNGFLYVSETAGNKIRKIDLNNNTVTTVAGTGVGGFQNGPVTSAQFNNPFGMHVDNNGEIYVADYANYCIRKISNGQVTTFAGVNGSSGTTNGSLTTAKFNLPKDLICDTTTGDFYIADQNNNLIRKISGGMVSTFCGNGAASSVDGPASTASINHPVAICITSNGYLYVIDAYSNKIRKIDQTGTASTVAGNGNTGSVDGTGALAEFNAPAGICYDDRGVVYIADNLNHKVRKLTVPEVVSIRDNYENKDITMYPNPSTGLLNIETKTFADYLIHNSIGAIVKRGKLSEGRNKIDLHDLTNGVYFVTVTTGKETINQKITLQK